MDQVRALIHSFRHPAFSEYTGQIEFNPSKDSFFTSFGYAIASRVTEMKGNAQSLLNKLLEYANALGSTHLANTIYAINCSMTESNPILYLNDYYREGDCEDLAGSIKEILIPKLMNDGKNSAAKNVSDSKPVDIETDVYFNALMSELDIAIQLYKFDGTHRLIHRQNTKVSISLYVDESLNWSVLIHQNEDEFRRTHSISLLQSFPFKYGESRGGFSPPKPSKMETSIPLRTPEPEDPDLVLKQLIECLAGIADRQRIPADSELKKDLRKFIEEFHKLKPEWKLKQLGDLENYLNSLGNCTHENKTKVFSFCGVAHCIECMKDMIIREKIAKKADIKCPCGQKVAPKDTVEFRLTDIMYNPGQNSREFDRNTSPLTSPMTESAPPGETMPIKKPPSIPLNLTCFICNKKISASEKRRTIDGQSMHENCMSVPIPIPIIPETKFNLNSMPAQNPMPPSNNGQFMSPLMNPMLSSNNAQFTSPVVNPMPPAYNTMRKCQLCNLTATPSNILCERNHAPVCKDCAFKHSREGSCPLCKTTSICSICNTPIDTSNQSYGELFDGTLVHTHCYNVTYGQR